MKHSFLGKFSLIIVAATFSTSCDRKNKAPDVGAEIAVSTADLAREGRFSPWTSKAGLQLKMENLPGDKYFSVVEGRLKNGANQYRAIAETFDSSRYREWSVVWGFTEDELFLHEIRLLRAGFTRHHSQVFTDSSGIALHQLTMLRQVGELNSGNFGLGPSREIKESIPVVREVRRDDTPDFMKPELRRVDEAVITQKSAKSEDSIVREDESKEMKNSQVFDLVELPKPDSGRPGKDSQLVERSNDELTKVKPSKSIKPKDVLSPTIAKVESGDSEAAQGQVNSGGPESKVTVKPEPKLSPTVDTTEKTKVTAKVVTKKESKPEPKVKPAVPPKAKVVSYRVVKGDTLSSIARRFKVSVSSLKKVNGLRSDLIRLRQVLKIPKG